MIVAILAQFSIKSQPNNPSTLTNLFPPNAWLWAKYADCNMNKGNAITTDAKGNVYVTGQFNCPYFTLANGITIRYTCGSYGDVFVAKYDPNGNLLWANDAGGNGTSNSTGIAVDSLGNVYVTGYFTGTDINFDRFGTYNLRGDNGGASNLFFAKYDITGAPLYVRCGQSVPGTNVKALSVSCGKGNCVYITGSFLTKQFVWGNMTLTNDSTGFEESFVARIDGIYGYPTWGLTFNGESDERACSVAADRDGNAFVGGYFFSDKMYVGNDSLMKTAGVSNAFIARVDSSGNLLWMRGAGNNNGLTQIKSVSTDLSRNAYVEGVFSGSSLSIAGTTLSNTDAIGNSTDIMYARYDSGGNLVWAKSFGSSASDEATGISANGDIYLVGNFYGTALALGSMNLNNTNSPVSDMFFIRADQMGTIMHARSDGSTLYESVSAVSFDRKGNAHATGWFTDQQLALDSFSLYNYKTGSNLFVGKIGQAVAVTTSTGNTGTDTTGATGITVHQKDKNTLQVFPNPSSGIVNFSTAVSGSVIIFSALGEEVLRMENCSNVLQLNLNALPNGNYFIKVQDKTGLEVLRFLKE
jgi:hypothetical protein